MLYRVGELDEWFHQQNILPLDSLDISAGYKRNQSQRRTNRSPRTKKRTVICLPGRSSSFNFFKEKCTLIDKQPRMKYYIKPKQEF